LEPVKNTNILSPCSKTKLSAITFKDAYAGIVPKVIRLWVAVDPDLIRFTVVFTVKPWVTELLAI
jgi:hypothetical protein